jgi:hypothetical protein
VYDCAGLFSALRFIKDPDHGLVLVPSTTFVVSFAPSPCYSVLYNTSVLAEIGQVLDRQRGKYSNMALWEA